MSRLICGRCGNVTAPRSTYCPRCRWALYTDAPEHAPDGAGIEEVEIPRGVGGFFERRRKEGQRSHLEKQFRAHIDPRLQALEKRVENEPDSFEAQRALGVLSLLERNWERANAHLAAAHKINPNDCQTHINWAIVLAQRGQLQPALDLLDAARKQWAASPFVLFNQAIIALQARRYPLVLDAVAHLEQMWRENPTIAKNYHDEAMALRGLALFYTGQLKEAHTALEAAASHIVANVETPANAALVATQDEAQAHATPDEVEIHPDLPRDEFTGEEIAGNEAGSAPAGQLIEGKMVDADALCNLAIVEAAMGETNRAVARLSAALRMQPGHSHVLNNLGVLAYEQGRYTHAVHYLEIAAKIEDHMGHHDPAINNHLGVALSSQGNLEAGLERMQSAGGHERAEFEVFYNLGRAYIERGVPDRGVEYLKQAFHANPNNADVHVVLAAAYLLRGKNQFYPEARKHLQRALQLSTTHRVAYADLTLLFMEAGDREGALKTLRQALKINPNSAESLFMLGLMTMEGSNEQSFTQAATFFENVVKVRPDLVASLFNSALCQYLIGFRDPAAKILERVTAHDASIAPAYYLIGMGHAAAGRMQEALWAWQTALQFEPDNFELHANIAYIHFQRGDYTTAAKYYFQAHQMAPLEAGILGGLGLAYAHAKQFPRAIEAFRLSITIAPTNPVTHSNLGLTLLFANLVEPAMEEWRLVSQLDKGYAERRGEEMQKEFDDSLAALRPLNWRTRVVRLAPTLPRPHTRLLPGFNAQAFRAAISDPALLEAQKLHQEIERTDRTLAWMGIKH